jgi:anti-sigma-K factor RskA
MIIDHDRYMDEIGAYLLGALSADEADVLERHLEVCEQCRHELGRLRAAADALPRAVEPVEPPPALKRELMRAIRDDGRPAPRSLLDRLPSLSLRPQLAWAAAGAAVLVLAVGIGLAASSGGGSARTVAAHVTIQGARAELVIPPGDGTGATLRVSGMPQPAAGHIYELWLQRGGRVVPAALFSVSRGGSGTAGIAGSLRGVTAVMVTPELAHGADHPTRAPIVVAQTQA